MQCVYLAPVPVLSLFIYMGLRSTMIFPLDDPISSLDRSQWHLSYLGWYDILFGVSACLSIVRGGIAISKTTLAIASTFFLIILISLIEGSKLGVESITDSLVYFLRFFLAFILSDWLARSLGVKIAEKFLIALFFVLAISAIFVYSLQFGTFNRIYAAGMSVASFSQIAAVVCLIAIVRKYNTILLISLSFLLLTFSRTSIFCFLLLLCVYAIHAKNSRFRVKLKYCTLIAAFLVLTSLLLVMAGGVQFDFITSGRFNVEEIFSLNGRVSIWEYGLNLFESGRIPISGVGYNGAPSLISDSSFIISDSTHDYAPAHFHSIFLEFGFGLGIFSVFIFYYLLVRIIKTFRARCYPAFFIFSFFALSQSIDFTFYNPKEVIIWSLILGIAESQWLYEQRAYSQELDTSKLNLSRALVT